MPKRCARSRAMAASFWGSANDAARPQVTQVTVLPAFARPTSSERLSQPPDSVSAVEELSASNFAQTLKMASRSRERCCSAVYCRETYASSSVSYTHLRAHETRHDLVCRLLLE